MLKYDAVETLERAEIEGPGVRHMTPRVGGPNSKVAPFGWSLLKILPVPVPGDTPQNVHLLSVL
jgi:hypothetical protein